MGAGADAEGGDGGARPGGVEDSGAASGVSHGNRTAAASETTAASVVVIAPAPSPQSAPATQPTTSSSDSDEGETPYSPSSSAALLAPPATATATAAALAPPAKSTGTADDEGESAGQEVDADEGESDGVAYSSNSLTSAAGSLPAQPLARASSPSAALSAGAGSPGAVGASSDAFASDGVTSDDANGGGGGGVASALLWLLAFGLLLAVAHRLIRDGWWAPSWAGAYERWWDRLAERVVVIGGNGGGRGARVADGKDLERVELVPLSGIDAE